MLDGRLSARDKASYRGVADIGEHGATEDCMACNIPEKRAIEFTKIAKLPKEDISLRIARKGRSFLGRMIWWRDNFVSLAFSPQHRYRPPVSDLERRLRESQKKKRQLQRRIDELLGQG